MLLADGGRITPACLPPEVARTTSRALLPADELNLAVRPLLLGSGEHLFHGIDMHALGYECEKYVAGERAAHVFLRKRG